MLSFCSPGRCSSPDDRYWSCSAPSSSDHGPRRALEERHCVLSYCHQCLFEIPIEAIGRTSGLKRLRSSNASSLCQNFWIEFPRCLHYPLAPNRVAGTCVDTYKFTITSPSPALFLLHTTTTEMTSSYYDNYSSLPFRRAMLKCPKLT